MNPESQKILQRLLTWQRGGQWRRAAAGYRQLLREDPDCADAWHFYALLIYERRHPRIARRFMAHAANLAPHQTSIKTNLGRILREIGDLDAAEAHIQKALEIAPDHPPAWIQLTLIRLTQERGDELRAPLARLIDKYPSAVRLWNLIGQCHEQAASWDEALAAYAKAAQLAPWDPEPWLHRAEIEERMGQTDTAENSYHQALERDARCASAICALGSIANQRGDFAAGDRLSNWALKTEKACYTAWLNKTLGRRGADASELLDDLRKTAKKAGDDPEASPLYFALGMCLEAVKDYDAAFAAYSQANALRARELPYNRDTQILYLRNIIKYLDENFVTRAKRIGDPAACPIFVLGMPRSGTTLTESLLAAHSQIHAGGEMHWIHDVLIRNAGREKATHQIGEWLAKSDNNALAELAAQWKQGLNEQTPEGQRTIDKMPTNFMLIGLIHVCFPRSSIVHVKRDAMDTCFSCFATAFGQGHSFSNDLGNLGEFYGFYETLMSHWRSILGRERFIEVSYESLVNSPETELRRMFAELDLPWEEGCLDHYRERPVIRTASLWQARQPIYRTAHGRWRRFEHHLAPLRKTLDLSGVAAKLLHGPV